VLGVAGRVVLDRREDAKLNGVAQLVGHEERTGSLTELRRAGDARAAHAACPSTS
jgi:hypothetical protein